MAVIRLLVLGSPGSGKTTVARAISEALGVELLHMDDLYWGPDWLRPDDADWRRTLSKAVSPPEWILDGNHASSLELRLRHATHVLIIRTPTVTCLTRVVTRAIRISNGDRAALPREIREGERGGTRARSTNDFWRLLRGIARFQSRSLPRMMEAIEASGVPHFAGSVRPDDLEPVLGWLSDSAGGDSP